MPPHTVEPCEFCQDLVEWIATPFGVDLPDTRYISLEDSEKIRIFVRPASPTCDLCCGLITSLDIWETEKEEEALSMEVRVFRSRLPPSSELYDFCLIADVEGRRHTPLALWADAGTCRVYAPSLEFTYEYRNPRI